MITDRAFDVAVAPLVNEHGEVVRGVTV